MRILTLKNGEITDVGGINRTILELNTRLAARGHKCTVITSNNLYLPESEIYNGFRVIRINPNVDKYFYGLNIGIYNYLKKNLQELNPDIIHVHGYHGLFSVLIIYLVRKMDSMIPIVFSPYLDTYRSTFAGKYLWNVHKFISKSIFKKSSINVTCSKFEADYLFKNFHIDKNKINTIPLGVDVLEPTPKKRRHKKINLIYSGHLVDRKGVDFVIMTLNYLVNELNFKNLKLTIIGEGPKKKSLIKLSQKYRLEDYVIWKSFLSREDFIREISNSDIFLLLSKSEAFGIVIAESLTLGTPCIISNNTALAEFANENGCFAVDYPPDPREVSKVILRIREMNYNVGPLTDRIRSWDEVVDDYENLFYSLLDSNYSQLK